MSDTKTQKILESAPLGKKSSYIDRYTPSLLFPLPRKLKRDEIQVPTELPFRGFDLWTGFEISWLNPKGKPVVAIGEFKFPCESTCLIESKSFKLYLNSFNNSSFESFQQVEETMTADLSQAAMAPVEVKLFRLGEAPQKIASLSGVNLDELDVECVHYEPHLEYLTTSVELTSEARSGASSETVGEIVEETLNTNLLKSNCLVTGQPDWGSLQIHYRGHKINHSGLLQYVVSLRNHNEFHEQCVERIFMDITRRCAPQELSVYARYTRRGGLDINPYRTTRADQPLQPSYLEGRLVRQ